MFMLLVFKMIWIKMFRFVNDCQWVSCYFKVCKIIWTVMIWMVLFRCTQKVHFVKQLYLCCVHDLLKGGLSEGMYAAWNKLNIKQS